MYSTSMRLKRIGVYLLQYFKDYHYIANNLTSVEGDGKHIYTEKIKRAPDVQSTIDTSTVNIETSCADILLVISHSIIAQL